MLYVFLVNTGTMLTLDMALTMESVSHLQSAIEREHNLPRDKQVLMISGGQSLDPQMRVCSYSAGTDTNPIFLFSKETIEAAGPPSFLSSQGVDASEEKLQVEGLKDMPPSYSAVVARTQLALQFHDVAKVMLKRCEELVHDQHLQQQGWMAVVANLDDITSAFKQRSDQFRKNLTDFLAERPLFQERVSQFTSVLSLLEKTPLLPCLISNESSDAREITLLQWISNQDQKSTLNQMASQCSKALDQFTGSILENLDKECAKCLEAVDKPSMKEIKGLGERLFGLEQLMISAQKILTDQAEMAQGLVQNQSRVSNINDPSVLPDLCSSHQHQLGVMHNKHVHLVEICRRCQVAKEELCQNLHVRLRWIMYIEQQISAIHGKMIIYHESLKRLRKRLEIVRQVVTAPEVYTSTLVEIIRRKTFNEQYHQWAKSVSEQSTSVHTEELVRRKHISDLLHHHFLSSLFPGMNEVPPTFATSQPMQYDHQLPSVYEGDLQQLLRKVPELAEHLRLPHLKYYHSPGCPISLAATPKYQEIQTQTSISGTGAGKGDICKTKQKDASHHSHHRKNEKPLSSGRWDDVGDTLNVAIIDPSDGVIVDHSDFNYVDCSDGLIVEHSDGVMVDHSDGGIVDHSDGVAVDHSDGVLVDHTGELKVDLSDGVINHVGRTGNFQRAESPAKELRDQSDGLVHDDNSGPVSSDRKNLPEHENISKQHDVERAKASELGDLLHDAESPRLPLLLNTGPELGLSSIVNEPFYSAVGTPMDSNMPFLSTKQEDLDTTTADLENKISELNAKLEEIEFSKSVLQSQNVASERQRIEKENQLQKLCDSHKEKVESTNMKLKDFKENFMPIILQIKEDLRNVQKETNMGKEYLSGEMTKIQNHIFKSVSNILQSLEDKYKGDRDRKEAEFVKLKLTFEAELQDSKSSLAVATKSLTESKEALRNLEEMNLSRQKSFEFVEVELKDKKDTVERLEKEEKELLERIENLQEEVLHLKATLSVKETELSKVQQDHEEGLKKMKEEHDAAMEEFRSSLKMEYEMEIQDLELKICEKQTELEDAQRVKEEEMSELRKKLEVEKLEAVASMRKEAEKEHREDKEKMQKEMQETQILEMSELVKSKEMLLEARLQEQRQELDLEKQNALEELKEDIRTESSERMNLLISGQESEIETLKVKYEEKIEGLEKELMAAKSQQTLESSRLNDSLEESVMSASQSSQIERLENERVGHQQALQELRDALEQQNKLAIEATRREYEHKLERIRQSMNPVDLKKLSSAEKQVAFNEAISRITLEKDEEIARLKQRESFLLKEKEELEESVENLLSDKSDVSEEVQVLIRTARQAEKDAKDALSDREDRIRQLECELSSQPQAGPAELLVSSMAGSIEPPDSSNKLRALLQSKEQECHSLKKQLMHLRTSHGAPRGDRVCIKDIGVGDLVFVKYEEAHENYVVFTIESMCYFVHSESVHTLGLRTVWPKGIDDEEQKKEWTLGRVADKEYCQAKKAQNRFKVPLGTKFYRVKISHYDSQKPSS